MCLSAYCAYHLRAFYFTFILCFPDPINMKTDQRIIQTITSCVEGLLMYMARRLGELSKVNLTFICYLKTCYHSAL